MKKVLFALLVLTSMLAVEFAGIAKADDDVFMLEEITVTAQKREENQQKVATAMEVVSGEDLRTFGKNDIEDILSNISTVLIQSNTDGLRVSLRGISNDNSPFMNTQASTPTVAVNTDGVYSNRNSGNQGMYDVERVEVLFGPQSTMYASGSPGGIVNVVTSNPKLDKYEASGLLEYGNYDYLHTAGSMNAPVSDAFALRAAYTTSVHDGYLTNGSMDEDIKSARLKTLFQPNDDFSLVLTGEITKTAGQGFAGVSAFVDQDKEDNPWTSDDENAGLGRDQTQKKITAHMDWDLGSAGVLSIIPSYSETDNYSQGTTSGMGSSTYLTTRENDGYEKGIEARIASSDVHQFKWILGANFYKSNDAMYQVSVNQTIEENDQVSDVYNRQETKAIFGNLTYPVSDTLRVTAGARQSWDENTTSSHQIPCRTSPTLAECTSCTTMEYDDPNFKLGVEYDFSDSSMLYADWSSSYRMNGSGIIQKGVTIEPEELYAYTMGAKNRFFNNKVQLNISAYYYDYENYYANMGPTFIPVDLDGDNEWDPETETDLTSSVNIRTGDAEVYGFDIQTSTIITANDRLNLSVSYVKKKFTDLFFDFPEMLNYFGIEDLDYSGKEMPQSPNWNITANYDHYFNLPNGGSITASFEARYTSKYVLNWAAKELTLTLTTDDDGNYTGEYTAEVTDTSDVRWQEAYYLGDISIGYAPPDGQWTLNGYVKNVTDYAVKNFLDGMGNLMIGDPRTYGVVLSVKF